MKCIMLNRIKNRQQNQRRARHDRPKHSEHRRDFLAFRGVPRNFRMSLPKEIEGDEGGEVEEDGERGDGDEDFLVRRANVRDEDNGRLAELTGRSYVKIGGITN